MITELDHKIICAYHEGELRRIKLLAQDAIREYWLTQPVVQMAEVTSDISPAELDKSVAAEALVKVFDAGGYQEHVNVFETRNNAADRPTTGDRYAITFRRVVTCRHSVDILELETEQVSFEAKLRQFAKDMADEVYAAGATKVAPFAYYSTRSWHLAIVGEGPSVYPTFNAFMLDVFAAIVIGVNIRLGRNVK